MSNFDHYNIVSSSKLDKAETWVGRRDIVLFNFTLADPCGDTVKIREE